MFLKDYLNFITFLTNAILIQNVSRVISQPSVCNVISAIFNEGKSTIYFQSNNGFCKDWIVGPITKPQRIMISFSNVNIDCNNKDVLYVYNDDRNFLLYDYCLHSKQSKYVMARSKYLILRIITTSSKPLSATFDTILVDAPINSLIQAAHPPVFLTNSYPPQTISTRPTFTTTTTLPKSTTKGRNYNDLSCPFGTKVMTDVYGLIASPPFSQNTLNFNCSWIIKAPSNQRVYLLFDHVNLPQYEQYPHLCFSNFISISSENKPNEDYKLCGTKRGVKLVTTYNNVLINYVTNSIKDFSASFSLMYRIIADPSELSPQTTTALVPAATVTPSLTCGTPYFKPIERIVGGVEAVPNSWPWQVLITDGIIMCGATLVSNSWIVTAAHCTENINSGPIKAYIGMHNRIKNEPSKVTRFVSQVVLHPNYMGRLTQWDFDIALMKLQEPVVFSTVISPICLPPQGMNFATIGAKGWVTGWGDTQGTGSATILRQAPITVRKNKDCGANSDNMLCAGDKEPELHDSCQGDSGGPFFMKRNNNYYLVGIVSWGYDCGGAGVYTKVSNFVNWINKVIAG